MLADRMRISSGSKLDDPTNAPGEKVLVAGDKNAGYFGMYTGIYTGNELSTACNIYVGKPYQYQNTNIVWFKFIYEKKNTFCCYEIRSIGTGGRDGMI